MENYFLLDVRSHADYRAGHLPGSVNLPFGEIKNISCMVPFLDAIVYLYCETGKHSRCARSVLLYMGYKNIKNLGTMAEAAAFLDTLSPVCHNPR